MSKPYQINGMHSSSPTWAPLCISENATNSVVPLYQHYSEVPLHKLGLATTTFSVVTGKNTRNGPRNSCKLRRDFDVITLTSRPADRYRLLSEWCNAAEPSNIMNLHERFLHRILIIYKQNWALARICRPFKEPRNRFPARRVGEIDSSQSIPGLHNCLQIRALLWFEVNK